MATIEIRDVTKQYPNASRPAVDHASLSVEEGEFIVLLGPSGCGKTTLLKMVNRLHETTSGQIFVEGTEIHDISATELRRRIGYVIQATGLFPHMTIAENIATVPRLLKWDAKKIEQRIDELLTLVGLPIDYRVRYPNQLSGGEQQRVGIARALAADPRILLMDEPFGAIDAITRARLQRELREIQQRLRKTILFVTHDVEEALLLADRILVMRDGKMVQLATPLEMVTHPANDFVATLVGADDIFRTLGLLRADQAMQPLSSAADVPPDHVAHDENLRNALSRMLKNGDTRLAVVDGNGTVLGQLDYERIRRAARLEVPVAAG
jgi:osmoprotectant transport system ATP-binding protein